MKAILLASLLSIFVAFVHTVPTSFSTKFTVTTARYNYGYFAGTLSYRWDIGAFKLSFPDNDQYTELYIFNSAKGYPTTSSSSTQYSGQYLYKTSINCSCESTTLSYAMPYFATDDSTKLTNTGTSDTFNGISGSRYTTVGRNLVTDIWFANNQVLAFKMTDSRVFTLDQSFTSSVPSSVFTAPTGCKCGKPLDVVISLDRTGSIDSGEWVLEKEFTRNLTRSFDYGALKTNLAIINWNRQHWITITLNAGTSATSVSTAVEAMSCCGSGSCCCCGTDIGGGLWSAGEMLVTSKRPTATKAIILLTDGCQNHYYDETRNPPVIACPCGGESACASDPTCTGDITRHYNIVKNKIPGVKVIIVGVGTELCTSQLLLASGNKEENVYATTSWSQLSSLVTSLSATACTIDDDLCSGCCGFCSCGVCITPTQCTPPDACSVAAPDPMSGGCCSVTPKICEPQDQCHTVTCDPLNGCVNTPKSCRPNATCTAYICDKTDGYCKSQPIDNPICNPPIVPVPQNTSVPTPPPKPNCEKPGDCDYGDKCIISQCLGGNCFFNQSVMCQVNTKCLTFGCNSKEGCKQLTTTTCNDNNLCTTDSCNPDIGCVFTPIECPPTGDRCILTSCDKTQGCVNYPNTCANFTGNCTVGSCRNQSCHADNVCLPPPPPTGTSDDVPPTVVLGSSIGAAAVAAIIVCAIIALCGAGGGAAFAISQAGAGGGAGATQVNPLYKPTGHAGQNPLYRA